MKKAVSILLMVVIISMCTNISAQMDVKVTLDGNEIFFPDAKPFIDERDRVLVPIRFVSEALGSLVDWEDESRTAVIKQGEDEIRYTVYQPMAYLNDEMMIMDIIEQKSIMTSMETSKNHSFHVTKYVA